MQHICANQMDVEIAQIVYTQWLNEEAGIEADVTVTRTAEQTFMVVGPCASERRDEHNPPGSQLHGLRLGLLVSRVQSKLSIVWAIVPGLAS